MALWQFVLDLIPGSAANISSADAIRLQRQQLDEIRLSLSADQAKAFFDELGSVLPEKASWSKKMRIWGDEKTDDVQAHFDELGVEFVQFRIDVSNLSIPLISRMCALARRFNFVFATRDGAIVRPKSEAIVRELLRSAAMRFVRDPEGYLREAAQADIGPDQV